MGFTIHLTWRGQTWEVCLPVSDPTLEELGQRIQEQLGASFETLKLLVPGLKGQVVPARQREQVASGAGLSDGCKALLLASKAEDVSQVRTARELPGMRGFDDELRQAARRRRTARHDAKPQAPRAEYTFGAYESWQRPGLSPSPSEALKLLYRLASDPGILGVMAGHRYRVGLLSEMPPEGKVGVSPVCILGVNINAGQEISLRLRTDDLKGFRKYERIRETLIHELAHMEYGDHDNNFKQLNSQLGRECAAINARYVGGHTLLAEEESRFAAAAALDGGTRRSELDDPSLLDGVEGVMAATARLSGRTLRQLAAAGRVGGAAAATAGVVTTAAVAAASAVEVTAPVEGSVPAGSVGSGAGGSGSSINGDGEDGGDAVRQYEHFDATTERAEVAARRLGSLDEREMDSGGAGREGAGSGGSPSQTGLREDLRVQGTPAGSAAPPGEGGGQPGPVPSASEGLANAGDPMDVDRPTSGAGAGGGGGGAAYPVAMAAADAAARALPSTLSDACGAAGSGSVALGPERSTAEDGARKLQPSPQPARAPLRPPVQLILRPPEGLAPDGGAAVAGVTSDAAQDKLRQAWSALAKMAAATGTTAASVATAVIQRPTSTVTAEDVATALDTVKTLLGNAVHFPTEDLYRRLRLGNGAFQRRVGRLPGGLELLRVAGFMEESGGSGGGGGGAEGAVLRLRRNDPGLLWLVLSVVREAREQVAEQLGNATAAAAAESPGGQP